MAAALGIWLCAVAGPNALAKGGKGKKPGAATGNAAIDFVASNAASSRPQRPMDRKPNRDLPQG